MLVGWIFCFVFGVACGFVDYFSKKQEHILAKNRPKETDQTKYSSSEKSTKSLSKNVFESLHFEDKAEISPYDDYNEEYEDGIADNDEDVEHSDMGLEEDDESIQLYGPKKLLNTLNNNPINDSDEISHFSQTPFPTVTRNYPLEGKRLKDLPLPGPPRDLVAQIGMYIQ